MTAETQATGREQGRRMLAKLKRVLARVPFAETLVAAQYAARDSATPAHVKAALIATIAYFVAPADMIPDFIAGLGFTDDAAVLATTVRLFAPYITDKHHAMAQRLLGELRGRPQSP